MSDTFTYEGRTFSVEVAQDHGDETPWDWCDGHGPVSEWTRRNKRPGEWVLTEDRGSKRYYDFTEAMKEARRDGWDAKPYKQGTKDEQALRAVEADFKYLKDWCDGGWFYASLHVTLLDAEGNATNHDDYLGMVEYDYSPDGYWMDAAREIASNILYTVKGEEADILASIPIRNAMSEGSRV